MYLLIASILLASSYAAAPTHGEVGIQCNGESRAWKSAGPHPPRFGLPALKLATYPAAPLKNRILADWAYVRTYAFNDEHLVLPLIASAGTYEFGLGSPDGKGGAQREATPADPARPQSDSTDSSTTQKRTE